MTVLQRYLKADMLNTSRSVKVESSFYDGKLHYCVFAGGYYDMYGPNQKFGCGRAYGTDLTKTIKEAIEKAINAENESVKKT